MFVNTFYRIFLPKISNKISHSSIPRSGERGKNVNCYNINLDLENSPFYLVNSYEAGKLSVLKWNGESYEEKNTIGLSEIDKFEFRITHYYGLTDIYYTNIYSFAFHYITRLIYLKVRLYNYISSISQYFFNKRKLFKKKRMELLELMLNEQLDRDDNGIDIYDLMTKLYSIRWINHPARSGQKQILKIYLDSLVDSGEIEKNNRLYRVTGKAITTMERYEEEERRHIADVKLQRWMVYLTIILTIVAILSSGLIKFSPIIDLSNGHSIEKAH